MNEPRVERAPDNTYRWWNGSTWIGGYLTYGAAHAAAQRGDKTPPPTAWQEGNDE